MSAIEEQRTRERHDRDADSVIQEATQWAHDGDGAAALHLLESFTPPHPRVTAALAALREELAKTTTALDTTAVGDTDVASAPQPAPPQWGATPPVNRSAAVPGPESESRRISSAKPTVWYVAVAAALLLLAVTVSWRLWSGRRESQVAGTANTSPSGGPGVPTPGNAVGAERHRLEINAVPWVSVRIQSTRGSDETLERTTPFAVSLPAGEYRLEFRHPAFPSVDRSVTVGSGGAAPVLVSFPGVDIDRIVADVLGEE